MEIGIVYLADLILGRKKIYGKHYLHKEQYKYDEHLYKETHAIECLFSKMQHFRRIFSRFDKSARNFLVFLSFVGACIWLR
jgi:transposase